MIQTLFQRAGNSEYCKIFFAFHNYSSAVSDVSPILLFSKICDQKKGLKWAAHYDEYARHSYEIELNNQLLVSLFGG